MQKLANSDGHQACLTGTGVWGMQVKTHRKNSHVSRMGTMMPVAQCMTGVM